MNETKSLLLNNLADREQEMIAFLRALIQCETPNPPGDTRSGIAQITRFLTDQGIDHEVVAPEPTMPNVIARFKGAKNGPRLVMNGHVDVFPAGERDAWKHDPWGATLEEGRIYGRGACDMKSGTTALLFAFSELYKMREHLGGSATLTVVSDEETGAHWGSRYLLKHHPETRGDCLLNSEPTSPFALRFGEKGPLWLRFHVKTPGAHSAYAHMSANAVAIASEIILGIRKLTELRAPEDCALSKTLVANASAIDQAYGAGASKIITSVSVNPGVIKGGVKLNMIPADCCFEVDIRVAPEVAYDDVMGHIKKVVEPFPEASFEVIDWDPANASAPDHKMVGYLINNAKKVSGISPAPIIGLGATDARLWRQAGVPAFVYGPSPKRMGTSDEYVEVKEFMHIAKTHALSAFDFLTS